MRKIIKWLAPAAYRRWEIIKWERKGKPIPPPHAVKYEAVKYYAQRFSLPVLVETGTFRGDMIRAARNDFEEIYSVELDAGLYEKARAKFAKKTHIKLIHGDSGVEIGGLMKKLSRPALFWLGGHYSGGMTAKGEKDTPIMEELGHILDAPDIGHVILIDAAREFGGAPDYPTAAELARFIKDKRPHAEISEKYNIIRVTGKITKLILSDLADPRPRDGTLAFRILRALRIAGHACFKTNMMWRCNRGGVRFIMPGTHGMAGSVIRKGHYEHEQIVYFFNAARKYNTDIFLDIGANFGYYSLLAANLGGFSEIHAFEPHPETYQLLLLNIGENNFQNAISPHNDAASDLNKNMFINRRARGDDFIADNKQEGDISIKAVMLDSLFDFSGRRIAMKIDVEGHEIRALKGAENLLSRNKIVLQVEIFGNTMEPYYYLLNNGFRWLYRVNNDFYFTNNGG